MSAVTILALLALALSLLARRRRARAALGLDDLVIALALHLGLVGTAATLLAWAGLFAPLPLALSCLALALGCWPWTQRRDPAPPIERPSSLTATIVLLAVVAAGVGLRLPTIPAPLAGRDQGTYELRAALTLRTGSLGWTDEILATAGRELELGDPGPVDLLGLYPSSDEPWRARRYEAAYRPGAYLGERAAGEVVPQFFHLHPMLLAVAGVAFARADLAVTWAGALWLLALACCARRLWPRGPWAALAVMLVAGSPLAIWTGRTPLSENPMAALEWAAVLVALRLRDRSPPIGSGHETEAWWLAGLLALSAGVRGNALLLLPVVLAIAWLRPRARGSQAAYLVLGGLLASVIVHATTSYPYLHDELLRRLPGTGLGPASLIALALLGAVAWLVVDRELARTRATAVLIPELPRVLALGTLLAFVLWWSLRSQAGDGPPYARLDAAAILLGAPLLGAAALGVIVVARRWRARPQETWLLALAALIPCTALLYAPRELPNLGFFYYGRYLVPELLPAAALAATAGLEALVSGLAGPRGPLDASRLRRRLAGALGLLLGAGLLASVLGPLLRHPQLRLREYASAADAVEWLAARIPSGAVLIAGGEGWHHGHTYNQVGGALAMAHGVEVLPYRTREDAWLSAWELLVAGPERRARPAPPVFLLVNEAAHQHTRADGTRVALLDDQLWAPFVIERASLLELFVHALTPVSDQLPTRVARHQLRMGLLRVSVDPAALARIHELELELDHAAPEVRISGGLFDDGRACVAPKRPLRIELPRPADARHLVIVTTDADPRSTPRWRLRVDGQAIATEPPSGLRPHPRASLGPVPIPSRDAAGDRLIIELTPPALPDAARTSGECPWGRVTLVRTLPAERSSLLALAPEQVEATTIAPPEDFGDAIMPSAWTPGRSLSRYRPGTTLDGGKSPAIVGLSLELPAGRTLRFAPIDLPVDENGNARPLDLLVTLAGTRTDEGATLRIFADDHELGQLTVPPMRRGSWIAPPLAWHPRHDRAALHVELIADHGSVELRDLALFVGETLPVFSQPDSTN
ncbi:MAG: hypothetical protein R6X02_23515 [Enhygromyxa sp.]